MTSFLKERRSGSSGLKKDPFEVKALVQEIVSVTEDPKSRQFYEKVARSCPADLIFRILSEVKDEWRQGLIRTTKGAVFTAKLKRYCPKYRIHPGFRSRLC